MANLDERRPLNENRKFTDESQRQAQTIGYGLLAVLAVALLAWFAFDTTSPRVNAPTTVNAPGTTATPSTTPAPNRPAANP